MKTNNINNEEVSAFADGEISVEQQAAMMLALSGTEFRQSWDIYHHIGDVLRSDDMAHDCSATFNSTLSARLALEPSYLLPQMKPAPAEHPLPHSDAITGGTPRRRFSGSSRLLSGIAAGAAAIYFGGSYLVDVAGLGASSPVAMKSASVQRIAAEQTAMAPHSPAEQVVLRDVRMDAYLLAHQQFSPSLYSTAQFARSASFANESAK